MKWTYKILRIFFCPHKWKYSGEITVVDEEGNVIGHKQKCFCKYCGKWRTFRT